MHRGAGRGAVSQNAVQFCESKGIQVIPGMFFRATGFPSSGARTLPEDHRQIPTTAGLVSVALNSLAAEFFAGENRLRLLPDVLKTTLQGFPDSIGINGEIAMHQDVAHADRSSPDVVRVPLSKSRRKPARRFADDLQVPQNPSLYQAVPVGPSTDRQDRTDFVLVQGRPESLHH